MSESAEQHIIPRIDDDELPMLASVAVEALGRIEGGEPSPRELEELIRSDPSLTTKILRLANSPLFGGRVRTQSISQAVVRLGLTQLRNAIIVAATGEVFDPRDPTARALWQHSVSVSAVCQWLAQLLEFPNVEDCTITGLLHDVGKAVIYNQYPEAYAALIQDAAASGRRFYLHEREHVAGLTHDALGATLAMKWKLDQNTIEIIGNHHRIEETVDVGVGEMQTLALVSVANMLANQLGFGASPSTEIDIVGSIPGKLLGLTEETLVRCGQVLPELVERQWGAFA